MIEVNSLFNFLNYGNLRDNSNYVRAMRNSTNIHRNNKLLEDIFNFNHQYAIEFDNTLICYLHRYCLYCLKDYIPDNDKYYNKQIEYLTEQILNYSIEFNIVNINHFFFEKFACIAKKSDMNFSQKNSSMCNLFEYCENNNKSNVLDDNNKILDFNSHTELLRNIYIILKNKLDKSIEVFKKTYDNAFYKTNDDDIASFYAIKDFKKSISDFKINSIINYTDIDFNRLKKSIYDIHNNNNEYIFYTEADIPNFTYSDLTMPLCIEINPNLDVEEQLTQLSKSKSNNINYARVLTPFNLLLVDGDRRNKFKTELIIRNNYSNYTSGVKFYNDHFLTKYNKNNS